MTPRTWFVRRPMDLGGNPLTNALGVSATNVGLYSARPATTGSQNYYFATDDCGGTVYFDDPNGAGVGVPGWRLIQSPNRELANYEAIASSATIAPSSYADVLIAATAITIHFVLATPRSVTIRFDSNIQNSAADKVGITIVCVQAVTIGGVSYNASSFFKSVIIPLEVLHAAQDYPVSISTDLDLPAGTYDFKPQMASLSTGNVKTTASSNSALGRQATRFSAFLR